MHVSRLLEQELCLRPVTLGRRLLRSRSERIASNVVGHVRSEREAQG